MRCQRLNPRNITRQNREEDSEFTPNREIFLPELLTEEERVES